MDAQDKVIADAEKFLSKIALKVEADITKEVVDYLTRKLDLDKNGTIKPTAANRNAVYSIDKLLSKMEVEYGKRATAAIAKSLGRLFSANENYYKSLGVVKKNVFDRLNAQARAEIKIRLGISTNGKPIKGGYIEELIKQPKIADAVKKYLYQKVILGRGGYNDTIKGVKNLINGSKNNAGIVERHVITATIDTFAQVDRSINEQYADKLKLKAFIYAGGLIENSRDFCIKKNNRVFTTNEAEEWDKDPDLLLTKSEKENGGKPAGYNPLLDMGRWRCRHSPRFISNEKAIRLRPDLKGRL